MLKKFPLKHCLLIIMLTIFVGTTLPTAVHGAPQLNVTLNYFRAAGVENGVLLDWQTATELDTAGFKLKRDGSFLPDPSGDGDLFINNTGNDLAGGTYTFTDATAVSGQSYTYTLVEIEFDSNPVDLSDRTVTAGLPPTATNTPTMTPTATATTIVVDNGNQPTATATTPPAAATNTPVPTSVSQATNTPAPAATATAVTQNNTTAVATQQPIQPTATSVPPTTTSIGAATATPQPGLRTEQAPPATAVTIEGQPGDPQETQPDPNAALAQEETAATNELAESNSSAENNAPQAIGGQGTNNAAPVAIGSEQSTDTQNDATNNPTAQDNGAEESGSGRLYLWGGFIVAMLIFATAVVGAIILYTRRQA